MKPSFAIVGCGRVGTALGRYLTEAGYKLAGLADKDLSFAKRAADIIGAGHFTQVSWEITDKADIVFITTPDGLINEACQEIAGNGGFRKNAIVLHCSGAHPSTILSPAKNSGAFIGSMHPLQSFAAGETEKSPFKGIVISVEGDREAVEAAQEIATDFGAISVMIRTEAKTLYHAAAVVASNYLVTLLDLAFRLIEEAGISQSDAYKVLSPLVDGTLSNIEKVGIQEALTGPIARGDVETVERHLDDIGSKIPDLVPLYKMLGLHTINIAKARGALSESAEQALKKILEP